MSGPTSFSKSELLAKIYDLKHFRFGEVTIDSTFNNLRYTLLLLTSDCSEDQSLMELIGRWRKENEMWYLSQFEVTTARTTKWFKERLIDAPDRMLFIIKVGNEYIGHAGLFRFNFDDQTCELDNILRGEKKYPGIMEDALVSIMKWGKRILKLKGYTLKVLSDNERAIRLYGRLGLSETERIPLIQVEGKDGLEWTEAPRGYAGPISRYYVVMTLTDHSRIE